MSFTAGRVMVPVVPDLRGFQKTVGKSATGAGNVASQQFQAASRGGFAKAGSAGANVLKKTFKAGLAGGALFAGIAVKKGFDRLLGIEDARASLDGLGHDVKSIDKIMKNALNSVKGTAFGMADAGKVAASAVAAGVKPGKDLERTLKLTGDAATIAKVSFGDMGSIFGKVAASNKIQGDVIAQLNDQGIPIIQLLSKELGVSAEETVKLASQGKVNFATFQNAMEDGLGGAAKKSGDTMRGSFANMQAALGRVGANLLSGFFPKVRGGIQGITKWLAPMEDRATVAGKAIGAFGVKYGPPALRVLKSIAGAVRDFASKYGPPAIGLFKDLVATVVDLSRFALATVKVLWEYKAVLAVVAGGLLAYKAIVIGTRVAETALGLWRGRQLILMYSLTVAQRALNASMKANVLGLIVTGLTLLVGGLVLAYKQSSTFRNVVNGVWAAIKTGLAVAWAYIKPVLGSLRDFFSRVIPPAVKVLQSVFKVVFAAIQIQVKVWWFAIRTYFGMLKAFLTGVLFPVIRFLYDRVVKPVFTKLGSVISTVWTSVVKPVFSRMKTGVEGVRDAFSTVVGGIKSAWDGLKDIMAKPVNWVISNVINKLIGAINKIPGVPTISTVGLIGNTAEETGSDRAMAARGGKGGRGGRGRGGKPAGGKSGRRTWPANTRALSNNYAGHSGIDIAAPGGSPIRAASAGTVEYTGWGRGYGQAIFVRGDDGLLQIYGHSSKVSTRAGQRVSAGDLLGLVGSTGNSTGDHLHFEIAKSAPGTTSNRAATLAWLGGAKMGKSGPSTMDTLRASIAGVSAAGAPSGSWLDIGALTKHLKGHALEGGKKAAGFSPGKVIAKGLGALGGIGGKRKPSKAAQRAAQRKKKRAELKAKRLAAAQAKKVAQAARDARAKRAAARPGLLAESTLATLGSGAQISQGFLTGQLSAPPATQEQLRRGYEGAQAGVVSAADRVERAFAASELAARVAVPTTQRIGQIDRTLKNRRTAAQLSKAERSGQQRLKNARAAAGAKNAAAEKKRQERIAAAEKRLREAKTPAGRKSAQAALEKARKKGSGSSTAVTSAERNLAAIRKERAEVKRLAAEKKKLQGSKAIKDLAAAEAARAQALEAQTAAQEAATAAAEAYRAAQDAAIERATNVQGIGVGLGSIASAGFKTSGGIISNLRGAVGVVREWKGLVPQLISAGLRGPILEEFINAGPSKDALFTAKSLLRGGGIGTINDLQAELKAASIEAGALAGLEYTSPGATGGGAAGSWSSSSAPYRSAVAAPGVAAGGGASLTVKYEGMPADTVESIATKTSDRVVREFSRPGA